MDDTDTHPQAGAEAPELAAPGAAECVFCYVDRMLGRFGCDTTLRWARRWRDERMPRARGLERGLEGRGGFCDCEILLNGWTLCDERCIPDEDGELDRPPTRPACAGSAGSQPCGTWVPRRRDRW
jgi:Protein of unknown function (DUF2695)